MQNKSVLFTYLLSLVTILLKAYSQAYILITLMPEMTSFMTRTRWSVTRADLNLGERRGGRRGEEEEEGKKGMRKERGVVKCMQVNHASFRTNSQSDRTIACEFWTKCPRVSTSHNVCKCGAWEAWPRRTRAPCYSMCNWLATRSIASLLP